MGQLSPFSCSSVALLLILSLSVSFNVVTCVDLGSVAEQNYQEDFQRAFESQLELIENQNVGCLYDREVCSVEDRCLDDGLFGTCIAVYASEVSFTYRLLEKAMSDLRATLEMLVGQNYTWHDRYTQCCVRSALICASMQIDTDVSVCGDFARPKSSGPAREQPLMGPPERLKLMRQSLAGNQGRRMESGLAEGIEFQRAQRALQEFLDRHKYDYLVDIPEKKSDESDSDSDEEDSALNSYDWKEWTAKREGKSSSPGRHAAQSLKAAKSNAGEESNSDYDQTRRQSKVAHKLHSHDRPKQARQRDSKVDAAPSLRGGGGGGSRAQNSLAERLSKRWSGRDGAIPDSRFVDGSFLWVQFSGIGIFKDEAQMPSFISRVNRLAGKRLLIEDSFFRANATSNEVYFQLAPMVSPGEVKALLANETAAGQLKSGGKFAWTSYGFGEPKNRVEASELGSEDPAQRGQLASTLLVCGLVLAMIGALFVVFAVQRFRSSKKKLLDMTASTTGGGNSDYRDLCRQRMLDKSSEQREPVSAAAQQVATARPPPASSDSPNSSTGSWSDDPIATDMDITTGHLILNYMEEYLNNKEKLESEWASLCSYEADQTSCAEAATEENAGKNRYPDLLPFDHSRVILRKDQSATGGDYINASYISDSDPKVKSYILTQGPTEATAADFWQMLWESCSVTVVNLTKLTSDGGQEMCSQYWPGEGSRLFNRFEVHLVSEHIWCEAFLVRNFYVKNVATCEARTVTMFHFLSWDECGLPPSTKSLLDFRRKVNKSFKGRTSPLVIHCSDGCGRSGAYCLLDLALSRINKGVKEIDLAACLEHLRDQRPRLVKNQEQYEFVVTAIAEEVNNVLKTLPQ